MSRDSSSHSSKGEGFMDNPEMKKVDDPESSDIESDDLGSIADRRHSQDSTEESGKRDLISEVGFQLTLGSEEKHRPGYEDIPGY